MLTFNGKAALTLSLDVAPNYIEGLIAYIDGNVLYESEIRGINVSSGNVLAYITEMVEKLTQHAVETPHGITGVCVAIHGLVNQEKVIFTPNYALQSDLKAQLEEIFPFYVYLENEANLAALGEYTFGSISDSVVSLSIHTGIGAGIVENGKLRTGKKAKLVKSATVSSIQMAENALAAMKVVLNSMLPTRPYTANWNRCLRCRTSIRP